ncbi:peptidoglycan glycosyltransferase/peptidoglycan DD-transpeptidase MrcA [Gammaproteobacteria bacterium]
MTFLLRLLGSLLNALLSVICSILSITMTLTLAAMVAMAAVYAHVARDLPDIQTLREVRLQVPLRIYSADGRLMAEIGEKRRIPLRLDQIPKKLVQTVLAVEDDRFFEHPGVDLQSLIRATLSLARTGEKGQGGSTITMQVARNFYLSPEKSYRRKIREIALAFGIERAFTKNEILELYLNKIYFGNRAYGVGAAAQVYYGLPVEELNVAQMAMIAGLPKAPSRDNPLVNPSRSLTRRAYVLNRLLTLGIIDSSTYDTAIASPETARLHGPEVEANAPYLVEMVRAELVSAYGEDAYTAGFRVYTTLNPTRQRAADTALREGLLDYEERHGYRGPEGSLAGTQNSHQINAALATYPTLAGLPVARVMTVEGRTARVQVAGHDPITLDWAGISWARRRFGSNARGPLPRQTADVMRVGDVVRVHLNPEGKWRLAQRPEVSGALISLNPQDGAIVALTGGYDFFQSKFNRAIQAERQPGSSFKPFIYSAGLERGYTPASIFNDAPLTIDLPGLPAWRPENYGGKYHGPTRLREALIHSLNMVSIRLLQAIGVDYAIDYATRFGFARERMPRNFTLALGTLVATPLEMAGAYATFANGGYRVTPYFIRRVEDEHGATVFQAEPPTICRECPEGQEVGATENTMLARGQGGLPVAPRVVDARNVYMMNSMLRDVVRRGTAARAKRLGRSDLAGKTGTTNEERDTWFSGFNSELLTTVWIGYDHMEPLGRDETGGKTALPIWMDYMAEALRGVPEAPFNEPPGLVTVRINGHTGYIAAGGEPGSIFETFRADHPPTRRPVVPEVDPNAIVDTDFGISTSTSTGSNTDDPNAAVNTNSEPEISSNAPRNTESNTDFPTERAPVDIPKNRPRQREILPMVPEQLF